MIKVSEQYLSEQKMFIL